MAEAKLFVTVMHRGREWAEYLVRRRITTCLIAIAVAVYGVVLRFAGLGRSLWLDEAWVANSVATSSLAKMFYYKSWLQTSPPLFLVLIRETVAVFGLTNAVLRAIPLLMGLFAMAVMFILARQVFIATVCASSNSTVRALSSCSYVFEDTEAVQLRACG